MIFGTTADVRRCKRWRAATTASRDCLTNSLQCSVCSLPCQGSRVCRPVYGAAASRVSVLASLLSLCTLLRNRMLSAFTLQPNPHNGHLRPTNSPYMFSIPIRLMWIKQGMLPAVAMLAASQDAYYWQLCHSLRTAAHTQVGSSRVSATLYETSAVASL